MAGNFGNRDDLFLVKRSNPIRDRGNEYSAVNTKQRHLQLLELPIDVLKLIIQDVTHTNDLTALALTHSSLYNLAIPLIYSRFDIVWPDFHAASDSRTGVDALTFGLTTLCLGNSFSSCKKWLPNNYQNNDIVSHTRNVNLPVFRAEIPPKHLSNQYSQYTRKFSIGNGPPEWVQEYLITKESGKMLGTLVAIALSKMKNLDTFIWDMPTGVLSDVWLALASHQQDIINEPRLERVWVRWHDNSENIGSSTESNSTPQMLAGSTTMSSIGWKVSANPNPITRDSEKKPATYAQSRVEYPTLSVLPPLKSLSVLDIDQLEYLDEMSVLIAKSKDRIRELRLGISSKVVNQDFVIAWDGIDLQQVDHSAHWPGASTIGQRRLGGVLGVLLGKVFDIRENSETRNNQNPLTTARSFSHRPLQINSQSEPSTTIVSHELSPSPHQETLQNELFNINSKDRGVLSEVAPYDISTPSLSLLVDEKSGTSDRQLPRISPVSVSNKTFTHPQTSSKGCDYLHKIDLDFKKRLDGKLKLQTLELERVPLSVEVLQKAFDWSIMTNLTILNCPQHECLWEMLLISFEPTTASYQHNSKNCRNSMSLQYKLNLKKVHTDAASPALISFLKETLAPNSLETLFLQNRKRSTPIFVTIDAIFRGPLKRHQKSLKRLIIDSSDKALKEPLNNAAIAGWTIWMPNRVILDFITSGRMSKLRELSIVIDYKDWHHFLQRLPQIPHLRSLNIPFLANHVMPTLDSREYALQIVDVIALRPEVELCYMGILDKCFEVLEGKNTGEFHGSSFNHSNHENLGLENRQMDDQDFPDIYDNETAVNESVNLDTRDTDSENSEHDNSDTDSHDCFEERESKPQLRLREILFYDEKVSIFKGRFGSL